MFGLDPERSWTVPLLSTFGDGLFCPALAPGRAKTLCDRRGGRACGVIGRVEALAGRFLPSYWLKPRLRIEILAIPYSSGRVVHSRRSEPLWNGVAKLEIVAQEWFILRLDFGIQQKARLFQKVWLLRSRRMNGVIYIRLPLLLTCCANVITLRSWASIRNWLMVGHRRTSSQYLFDNCCYC